MRLITFGCSITYGHGLEDCCFGQSYEPGPIPSKLAWPSLLAEKLNLECVNLSRPGFSNKAITKKILEFEYQTNDIVVVQWTFKNRSSVFIDENQIECIGPWLKDKKSRKFYEYFYSDIEGEWDFQTKSLASKSYLDLLGLKNYHLALKRDDLRNTYYWNKVNYLPIFFLDIARNMEKALDQLHPGSDSHRIFADGLFKII
jgi:hypothetical protein